MPAVYCRCCSPEAVTSSLTGPVRQVGTDPTEPITSAPAPHTAAIELIDDAEDLPSEVVYPATEQVAVSQRGPLGTQVSYPEGRDLAALGNAAVDAAIAGAADATEGGVVVVCVPPEWLVRGAGVRPLLRQRSSGRSSRKSNERITSLRSEAILSIHPHRQTTRTVSTASPSRRGINSRQIISLATRSTFRCLPRYSTLGISKTTSLPRTSRATAVIHPHRRPAAVTSSN